MPAAHVSTAPLAVTNLIAAITAQAVAAPGFSLDIIRGMPGDNQPLEDVITIHQVTRTLAPLAIVGDGGYGRFTETFVIEVEIWSFRGGDDAATVEARAWQLVSYVELGVRSDLTLGGAVLEARLDGNDMASDWAANATGRLATTTVLVNCWSEI